ncbi:MAG TPA: carboxylating nicotinate-nucleotide diphosphorylase [Acidimicrobiales bacterium]|nr:carboxylating nicotinate-nucleotide diphosphorylase [Acidimicrobiales bacterium]
MTDLEQLPVPWEDLRRVVALAVAEDLPLGDPMGEVVGDRPARAVLTSRTAGTLAGLVAVPLVLDEVSRRLGTGRAEARTAARDGEAVSGGQVLGTLVGPAGTLLSAERSLLNFLTHLSGVATATAAMVSAVAGTGALIRDTRKTLPGLRALEKYAVRCGGGSNHRMSLSEGILVKDNHVAAMGGVAAAVAAARRAATKCSSPLPVEVEVDDLRQLDEALAAGADLVLLDNMGLDMMAAAVARARAMGAKVEASGGIHLGTARAVAECGVDYIAVGAITHSAPALDIGLDWEMTGPAPA